MIEWKKGNLLEADVEALVNTVNTVGVMGKGLALQFRQAFPENYKIYQKACKQNKVQMGRMFVVPTDNLVNPRYIINFPTKKHWKGNSHIEDIKDGLDDLVKVVDELKIKSIAVPPLGCGYGGLSWDAVMPLIQQAFSSLDQVRVFVFTPDYSPIPEDMQVATQKPNLTIGRAAIIQLISRYALPGYLLTHLEIQKLAYFLQSAGEPLKLNFTKQQYGPYAENLNFVLQRLEGHYIRGYGDRTGAANIHLMPGADEAANVYLENYSDSCERLKRVIDLIEGFESPYGMELLATVHWLAQENPLVKEDYQVAVDGFKNWNERKRQHFRPEHIQIAWQRLLEQQWI